MGSSESGYGVPRSTGVFGVGVAVGVGNVVGGGVGCVGLGEAGVKVASISFNGTEQLITEKITTNSVIILYVFIISPFICTQIYKMNNIIFDYHTDE